MRQNKGTIMSKNKEKEFVPVEIVFTATTKQEADSINNLALHLTKIREKK